MSAKTNLFYAIGQRGGFWTLEAVNWESGETVWYVKVSPLPAHNSFYAATEIGPDGCIYSGTLWGLLGSVNDLASNKFQAVFIILEIIRR